MLRSFHPCLTNQPFVARDQHDDVVKATKTQSLSTMNDLDQEAEQHKIVLFRLQQAKEKTFS